MMWCALGEVVRPGQRCTLHADGQKTAEQPAGISVRDCEVHDEATAGIDDVPEGQPVFKRSEAMAKDRRERQKVGTVEGGFLHVRLIPPPVVHAEVEEPDDLFISDVTQQLLPVVLVDQEIGKLAERLLVLPKSDDGVL